MKHYFAKYLPVEGEVKEGDEYRVKGSDKILKANKHFKEIDQSLLEKVKLFLCSRDIKSMKIGDKVQLTKNAILNKDGEFELDKLFEKVLQENPLLHKHLFKVIGEISPDVIFVKEGDEFEESEVAFIHEPGEDMDTEFIPISDKPKHRSKKYLTEITIKCKCCGIFVR